MTRVRLRRSGAILFLQGPAPTKAGDRFRASRAPLPTVSRESGCKVVEVPGGFAFTCTRRSRPTEHDALLSAVLDYVFNPDIHEVLP